MDDLPSLSPEARIKLNTLCHMFFNQFMSFAEFINEDPQKVPTIKYAAFVAYMLTEEVRRLQHKDGSRSNPIWDADEDKKSYYY